MDVKLKEESIDRISVSTNLKLSESKNNGDVMSTRHPSQEDLFLGLKFNGFSAFWVNPIIRIYFLMYLLERKKQELFVNC